MIRISSIYHPYIIHVWSIYDPYNPIDLSLSFRVFWRRQGTGVLCPGGNRELLCACESVHRTWLPFVKQPWSGISALNRTGLKIGFYIFYIIWIMNHINIYKPPKRNGSSKIGFNYRIKNFLINNMREPSNSGKMGIEPGLSGATRIWVNTITSKKYMV